MPFDAVQGSKALIFVDEFNLSPQSSGAQLTAEVETSTYNIMGDAAAQVSATTPNFSISHSGYYTGEDAAVAGYFEKVLSDRFGTSLPVVVTLVLDTLAYVLEGTWGSQLTFDAPVDGLITIEGNWSAPDKTYRGVAGAAGTNLASNGVTPAVDLGANFAQYTKAVLHAAGFSDLSAGADKVTVNVQTSATQGGTYVTWLTYDFKKPGAKVVSGAAATNRWVRFQVVLSAGVPGPVDVAGSVIS